MLFRLKSVVNQPSRLKSFAGLMKTLLLLGKLKRMELNNLKEITIHGLIESMSYFYIYLKCVHLCMDRSFDDFFGDSTSLVTVISKRKFSFKLDIYEA